MARREYGGTNSTRIYNLQVRLNEAEYAALNDASLKAEMTISAFVRSMIPPKPARKRRKKRGT